VAAGEIIRRLTRRPQLWLEAGRMLWSVGGGGWSTAKRYLAWRSYTAYGTSERTIDGEDLERFLVWRRNLRRVR